MAYYISSSEVHEVWQNMGNYTWESVLHELESLRSNSPVLDDQVVGILESKVGKLRSWNTPFPQTEYDMQTVLNNTPE